MLPNFRVLHWELSGGREYGVQEPHTLAVELSKPLPPPGCPGPRSRGCYWGSNWFIILLAEIKPKELEFFALWYWYFHHLSLKATLLKSISPEEIEFLLKSLMKCFREPGFLQRLPSHPGKKQDKDTKISRPGSSRVMSDEGHPTKVLNVSISSVHWRPL